MKKLLILALVVTIAGAAFADTDPAFSGSFSTYFGYSIDGKDFKDSVSDSMALDLNATIDDFNTVSVTVGLKSDVLIWDSTVDNVFDPADTAPGADDGDLTDFDKTGDFLRMDAFTLTSDITGALGVDGPVGVSVKLGKFKFASPEMSKVAAVNYTSGSKTDSDIGIEVDVELMDMITIAAVAYPDQYIDDAKTAQNFGVSVSVMGIADMIDVGAYYILSDYDPAKDAKGDTKDGDGQSVGASVGVAILDNLSVGANFEYNFTTEALDDVASMGINVGFTADALALGLAVGMGDFAADDLGFKVMLGATYDFSDAFGVFGAIEAKSFSAFDAASSLSYDVGVTAALGALAIQLGLSDMKDFKAPEDDFANVVYVKFSTSF